MGTIQQPCLRQDRLFTVEADFTERKAVRAELATTLRLLTIRVGVRSRSSAVVSLHGRVAHR